MLLCFLGIEQYVDCSAFLFYIAYLIQILKCLYGVLTPDTEMLFIFDA